MNNIIVPSLSPLCRFCKEKDETFDHLNMDCPVFCMQRREIMGHQPNILYWTPKQVLDILNIDDIKEAMTKNVTEKEAKGLTTNKDKWEILEEFA